MPLPVVHLTCWLESEKPATLDLTKQIEMYKCPVYPNRSERSGQQQGSIFEIDMMHAGMPSQKWAMRGVCATLKPF